VLVFAFLKRPVSVFENKKCRVDPGLRNRVLSLPLMVKLFSEYFQMPME